MNLLTTCRACLLMQCHLAANVRRNNPPCENGLIVRECAIVVTDIRLLAQGDMRYWIQAARETDDADWALFEAVKTEPGFAPPTLRSLSADGLLALGGYGVALVSIKT